MRIKLDRYWTDRLVALPESGMGYQRVRIRLKSGRIINDALAFNAQELELPADAPPVTPGDIVAIDLSSSDKRP